MIAGKRRAVEDFARETTSVFEERITWVDAETGEPVAPKVEARLEEYRQQSIQERRLAPLPEQSPYLRTYRRVRDWVEIEPGAETTSYPLGLRLRAVALSREALAAALRAAAEEVEQGTRNVYIPDNGQGWAVDFDEAPGGFGNVFAVERGGAFE